MFSSHPELLSLLPFTESLEDNEAISASGLANYSIIHDDLPAVGGGGSGRNKAVLHPGARQAQNNNNNNNSSSSSRLKAKVSYIIVKKVPSGSA